MRIIIYCLVAFTVVALPERSIAQKQVTKKDLRSEWLIYQQDAYVSFDKRESAVSTIYFWVDTRKYAGDALLIASSRSFDLFVNGQVAGSGTRMVLNIDSLSGVYFSGNLLVGVRQPKVVDGAIVTRIRGERLASGQAYPLDKRQSSSFRDFAIIGFILLLIIVIIIVRLNPKLAWDYFSVTKIFSLREADDNQVYSRITSSTNILFYAFCSLMLSYYLMIIFHFVWGRYTVALFFQGDGFFDIVLQWLELSVIVFGVFLGKIVLVFGLSFLFGLREIAGIHFFNWVRLLLVFFGALTVMVFFYFVMRGHSEGVLSTLLQFLAWLLGGWIILIFLKLSGKMSSSLFHLFSYICATELIPFLITIKVLYN